MKTKKILKQILTIILATLILLILNIGESKAALQANPNTQYKKTGLPTNFMPAFRQMETSGGAMGLSETLNTDLTPSSDSNGIDVHMMRTTEYGAIAILSASGYGNPSNDKTITSTTGNNTGVMLNTASFEWTAGGASVFSDINSRYFDAYTTSYQSARAGDALGNTTTTNPGCIGWHGTGSYYGNIWVRDNQYFIRGNGGIFSACYSGVNTYWANTGCFSRGVAVVGSGI